MERWKYLCRISYNNLCLIIENFIPHWTHVVILTMIDIRFSAVLESFCQFFESFVRGHAESLILAPELKRDARLAFLSKLFVQFVKPLNQNLVSRKGPKLHSFVRWWHHAPFMGNNFNCFLGRDRSMRPGTQKTEEKVPTRHQRRNPASLGILGPRHAVPATSVHYSVFAQLLAFYFGKNITIITTTLIRLIGRICLFHQFVVFAMWDGAAW